MSVELTPAAIEALLREGLPELRDLAFRVEDADAEGARVRRRYDAATLRPGGTISGPTLMALADCAMYAAVLARYGPQLLAVTTDLSIHFLRRPQPSDLIAQARILKAGKRLVILAVEIGVADGDELVAHATGSYALPPS